MPLEESIKIYRRQARFKIEDVEYEKFMEKYNITNINNIRDWLKENYDNLIEKLERIVEDGSRADDDIKDEKDERNIPTLVDHIREGIMAEIFLKTSERYRNKSGGYKKSWNFKRLLKQYENNRDKRLPEERTGGGVKVFTSNADIVDRLMLLKAGNESVEIDNEIIDILDHLRSSGLLTSSEYEILHRDLI